MLLNYSDIVVYFLLYLCLFCVWALVASGWMTRINSTGVYEYIRLKGSLSSGQRMSGIFPVNFMSN